MKKGLLVAALVMVLLLALAGMAVAAPAETGHYSYPVYWEATYNYGPSNYYGQDVRIVYQATSTWTYVVKGNDVRQTAVHSGTATVYDLPGNVIDIRPYKAMSRFFDAGMDAVIVHDLWYEAIWYSPNLEEYQSIVKIPGVYDLRHYGRNGIWSYGWTSGGVEGGLPGGWPPHPIHP